jgi:hypothetical protein
MRLNAGVAGLGRAEEYASAGKAVVGRNGPES